MNARILKEREEECYSLRCQLADAKNIKFNNQELHDALIADFKKTISVIFCFIFLILFSKKYRKKKILFIICIKNI